MFNSEFYPTPKAIIKKMVEPYRDQLHKFSILEPSAGKGDILDYLKDMWLNKGRIKPENLYAIELDPELKLILQGKNYKVIADDFLQYTGEYYFDLIVMNPPFSNGDDHLLKAWDILKAGEIVCLLNEETIKNPFSQKRKLIANLIQEFGSVEYLGPVFVEAERVTCVNVALVRLSKKVNTKLDFDFERVTVEGAPINLDEESIKNPLAVRDIVGNMILQYEKTKEAFINYMKAIQELGYYGQDLLPKDSVRSIHKIADEACELGTTKSQSYNLFADGVKQTMWLHVLSKLNVEKLMTRSVRDNFQKWSTDQGYLDFTRENVQALINMLYENSDTIMNQCIVDVFDIFTRYYDENRMHVEGWKTNDKWKVNKKVILPNFLDFGYNGRYRKNHNKWNEYSDIDKAMAYITGKNLEEIVTLEEAIEMAKWGDSSLHESEFFKFRCYKKGTLHIEFKDKWLWQEFNMRACSGKNWLPESDKQEWYNRKKTEKSKRLAA